MSSTTTPIPKEPKITKKMTAKAAIVSKPKTPSSHPPYNVMILAAMAKLISRGKGVSTIAISKHVDQNYEMNTQKNSKQLKQSLKRLVFNKLLVKHKGIGAAGSFRLSTKSIEDAAMKKKKTPESKTNAKKPAAPKKAKPATAPAKKPSPKKTPPKAKPKAKPKDVKKPKKTTKPAAKTKKPPAKKPKTPKKTATKKK